MVDSPRQLDVPLEPVCKEQLDQDCFEETGRMLPRCVVQQACSAQL